MSRIVISLSGTARSGKDTVADFLARKYAFTKLTWAKPLKMFCYSYYNLIPERIEEIKDLDVGLEAFKPHKIESIITYAEAVIPKSITPEVKAKIESLLKTAKIKSFREALLFFGTTIFRETVNDQFWIEALKKFYPDHEHPKYGNMVFTDTRFPNELEYALGLDSIKYEKEYTTSVDVFVLKNSEFKVNHKSESFRSEQFQYVIDNNGTLEDLERRVDELFYAVVQKHIVSDSRS